MVWQDAGSLKTKLVEDELELLNASYIYRFKECAFFDAVLWSNILMREVIFFEHLNLR